VKNIIGLIPSRLNSKRLSKKPLLLIDGLPMIVHTAKRAMMSKSLKKVIVCTDSDLIIKICKLHGIESMITSKRHLNGTERIAEVSKKIKSDLVIDIQGDEPFIDPRHIDKLVEFHKKNRQFEIVVPSMKFADPDNKNIVKVVSNCDNQIIYLSRQSLPFFFNSRAPHYYKHLSIISFLPDALKNFGQLKRGKLEKIEGIELLRALENNIKLGTLKLNGSSFAIDVKDDYLRALSLMPKDKWRRKY
jgi:3-deoxy-manno-octulosonate cytidylyltransferase (CMP-KDO synthetase)